VTPRDHPDIPRRVLTKLRALCLALPDAYEEEAWVGTRWMVRKKNVAHVLVVDRDWPPVYAGVLGPDIHQPACVLTFRSAGEELEVLRNAGAPFFNPPWFDGIVGMQIDDRTDWGEVAELVTDSYCALAPKKLVALVDRPDG
jgi:hypothetical protein